MFVIVADIRKEALLIIQHPNRTARTSLKFHVLSLYNKLYCNRIIIGISMCILISINKLLSLQII